MKTFSHHWESGLAKVYRWLGNGLHYLVPLFLVTGLYLLGAAALGKQEKVNQKAQME
ncbi:MAG: hypothetical protein HOH86_01770, partial [Verrucomicrobiales bacterium]|nr:hypothetical protein [Verrucomicrobiales bacterium]